MADDFFPWKDEYSVGNLLIDRDHQELFRLVNELNSHIVKMGDLPDLEELKKIIDTLMRYIEEHFEREEFLMAESGYPHLKDHRKKHHDFIRFVYALRKVQQEEPNSIEHFKLRDFLKDWLERHVTKTDRDYIPFLSAMEKRRKTDELLCFGASNQSTENAYELVTVPVQVPFHAVNILRRCARILRLGGEDAKKIEDASDPLRLIGISDAKALAKIVLK